MPVSSNSAASHYVGRFAPSPTGPLHFGSLIAALASFLDARAAGGRWLVRMEDLDPPREQPGASNLILAALAGHGLAWDGEVVYQSQRHERYRAALQKLQAAGRLYACACSRQRLLTLAQGYDGFCLKHPPKPGQPVAIKCKVGRFAWRFEDRVQGEMAESLQSPQDDFVLLRKDGLFAYQLAVVVDDHDQGVTDIVRGSDLLDSTVRQACLYSLLDYPKPSYAHLPVAENRQGQKLSKQNHAPALVVDQASNNLVSALIFLNQQPPRDLRQGSVDEIIRWAIGHWQIDRVPKQMAIVNDGR
ncbi:tRNA glutamyl-Q(34) synthetase GluQRS [Halioxenophilus sp. WMMB6]|uniref:tRNA glutamyl-Q(34) synthetase GluQRS n=1 Tax=Halioxenophilus sp. WMMB6 TaxID=3073815 RepID=UPI00295E3C4C|nr:tRNA glutamyl-Q(34) synthetase GluQRS [Halioxenophilus sp. WMMB6]